MRGAVLGSLFTIVCAASATSHAAPVVADLIPSQGEPEVSVTRAAISTRRAGSSPPRQHRTPLLGGQRREGTPP